MSSQHSSPKRIYHLALASEWRDAIEAVVASGDVSVAADGSLVVLPLIDGG